MCIIIQGNPKNVSKKILKNAYSNNPHGLGVMYFDNDSRLIQDKIYPKNFSDVKKFFKKHKSKTNEIGIHFRYCTVGKKKAYNSHPYNVLNKDHQFQMGFMHNSPELPHVLENENRSDSYFFVKQYFAPIISRDISLIRNDEFLENLKEIINLKTDSRVLIADTYSNDFTRVGNWIEKDNLFLSNSYGLREPYIWKYTSSNVTDTTTASSVSNGVSIDTESYGTQVEKTEFAGRQSYEVSNYSTYNTANTKTENEINKIYDILASGNKADYLKIMTENSGALATVLKECFFYSSDSSYLKNDSDEIQSINDEVIKKHG